MVALCFKIYGRKTKTIINAYCKCNYSFRTFVKASIDQFVMEKEKVLELFSGIGGMHFSLLRAKIFLNEIYATRNVLIPGNGGDLKLRQFDFEVVGAIDISEVANKSNVKAQTISDSNDIFRVTNYLPGTHTTLSQIRIRSNDPRT